MARKGRISKIRVLTYLRGFAESEVEAIDRFRAHVHDAAAAERRSIERRANNLPSEIQEFLADDLHELDAISDLLVRLALRRFFIRLTTLHLTKNALALDLLLWDPESLIDIVVANEYPQMFSDRATAALGGRDVGSDPIAVNGP